MDADGEDKATDITNLVNEAEKNNSKKKNIPSIIFQMNNTC